ncbi:MAG TPA: acyl-CoA thioesterase [Elusimicrobiales bacterium]|nr:acyl-CoA thioesterase [Elusimicrobiales bacterium]
MAVSKIFEFERAVVPGEIDELGHVNNQVYLDWFMDAATRHSALVGWDLGRMIKMGDGWVVRRHEIDYLLSVKPDEKVLMRTWVETAERASSERHYEIARVSDGRKVCCGRTMWVWINYKTGRPSRIPEAVIKDFTAWEPAAKINP